MFLFPNNEAHIANLGACSFANWCEQRGLLYGFAKTLCVPDKGASAHDAIGIPVCFVKAGMMDTLKDQLTTDALALAKIRQKKEKEVAKRGRKRNIERENDRARAREALQEQIKVLQYQMNAWATTMQADMML